MTWIVQTDEGLASATTYCDVDFADAHLVVSGTFDTWDLKTDDEKKSFLIFSSFFVDDTWDWRGEPVLDFPGLRFPRTELYDRDGRTITGVPRILKEGVAELAAFFVDNDPLADSDLAGIAAMSVDVLRISFSDASQDQKVRYPASTVSKLSLLGSGSVGGRRVAYVNVV